MYCTAILLLHNARVQTYLTKTIANYYAEKLNAKVTIGRVSILFFKQIAVEDVVVLNQQEDTIVTAKEIKFDVNAIKIRKRILNCRSIQLVGIHLNLKRSAASAQWNFQFLMNAINTSSKTGKPQHNSFWKITCDEACLTQSQLNIDDHGTQVHVDGISACIGDLNFQKDTLKGHLSNGALNWVNKLRLLDGASTFSCSATHLYLTGLHLVTAQSEALADVKFNFQDWDAWRNNMEKVNFICNVHKIKCVGAEFINLYSPFKNINGELNGKGLFSGRLNCFVGRKLNFNYAKQLSYCGDIDCVGLPDWKHCYFDCNIKSAVLDEKIVKSNVDLASIFFFKEIVLNGRMTGYPQKFIGKVNLQTGSGKIETDLKFSYDSLLHYSGTIKAENFALGKLISNPKIGNITIKQEITGAGYNGKSVIMIDQFTFNQYNYANISTSLNFSKTSAAGTLSIDDPNLVSNISFKYDFKSPMPSGEIALNLLKFNLKNCNILPRYKNYIAEGALQLNWKGNTLKTMDCAVTLDKLKLHVDGITYATNAMKVQVTQAPSYFNLEVKSDIIDANLSTNGPIEITMQAFHSALYPLFPVFNLEQKNKSKQIKSKFSFDGLVKNDNVFFELIDKRLKLSKGVRLTIDFDQEAMESTIACSGKYITWDQYTMNDFAFKGALKNGQFNDQCQIKQIRAGAILHMDNVDFNSTTSNQLTTWQFQSDNKSVPSMRADLNGELKWSSHDVFQFKVNGSRLVIADSAWSINPDNLLTKDSTGFHFCKNEIFNHDQRIDINGKVFKNGKDSLRLSVSNLRMNILNNLLKNAGIKVDGELNCEVNVSGPLLSPVVRANLKCAAVSINNDKVGNLFSKFYWDSNTDVASINGGFEDGSTVPLEFKGCYYPKKDSSLDLKVSIVKMKLDYFQPFLKEYCNSFSGHFSGNLNVKGNLSKPLIDGKLAIKGDKIFINYLGVSYAFEHDFEIRPNGIFCSDAIMYDDYYRKNNPGTMPTKSNKPLSNTALVNGKITHNNFKDFYVDCSIFPNSLMVLNTTETDNKLYYGLNFVTGTNIDIVGYFNASIRIDANIRADQSVLNNKITRSKLFIPLNNNFDLEDNNGFVKFINHDSLKLKKEKFKVNLNGVQVNLNYDFTPAVDVMLIFDQKIGDVIKANGNGLIKMEVNTLGKFNMYGSYVFENGDYLFTLQNIINKRFQIEKGGSIKWVGDPMDAEVSLNAIYKSRSSLSPLFPYDSSGTYKHRFPVECKLKLSNKLMKPDIGFEIDVPSLNDGARTDVRSIVNNDLEINRQVFSLLVLGGFITPQSLAGNNNYNTASSLAGITASSELLSNQLSNMLNQFKSGVDFGIKYSPGSMTDKVNNQELQLAMSTQLLNNRLSIDGNFGTSPSTSIQSSNTLIGDVNVEYKLTPDGKLKMRAFNKTNDNAIVYQTATYTQGVGIFYRKEFSTLPELFEHYLWFSNRRGRKKNVIMPGH